MVIETYPDLREWIIMVKLTPELMANALAMFYWEKSLKDQSVGNIYAFWCCAGMNRYLTEKINFNEIQRQQAVVDSNKTNKIEKFIDPQRPRPSYESFLDY